MTSIPAHKEVIPMTERPKPVPEPEPEPAPQGP